MSETTPPAVNVTRLLDEVASKAGVMWVEVPGQGTWPAWFVWHDDGDERGAGPAAYVVTGVGEQRLPHLATEVTLIFRSKDTGARLLGVRALGEEVPLDSAAWEPAAQALRAERLNAVGDVLARWRQDCAIFALRPLGVPEEQPGSYDHGTGGGPVEPAAGVTTRWRPWHAGDRATARRNRPSPSP